MKQENSYRKEKKGDYMAVEQVNPFMSVPFNLRNLAHWAFKEGRVIECPHCRQINQPERHYFNSDHYVYVCPACGEFLR